MTVHFGTTKSRTFMAVVSVSALLASLGTASVAAAATEALAPSAAARTSIEAISDGDDDPRTSPVYSTGHGLAEPRDVPLRGCNDTRPNIGGVVGLKATFDGENLKLDWSRAQTRNGVKVLGYNVYRQLPGEELMQFIGWTQHLYFNASYLEFLGGNSRDGVVGIQVAAYSAAEEGCRAATSISGRLAVKGTVKKITKRNWDKVECQTLGNQTIFTVAGWYKGNSEVVAPAAWGALALIDGDLDAAVFSFNELKQALGNWAGEVLGPVEQLRVQTIRCVVE